MPNTVVVYKSKYGSARRYAEWIAQDTQADLLSAQDVKSGDLSAYDTIVYCGGVYGGKVNGFAKFWSNFAQFSNKNIILVAVGAASATEETIETLQKQNLSPSLQEHVPFYYLRGGLNYKRMHFADRALMRILIQTIRIKKPQERTEDEKGILETYGSIVDFCSRTSILPIVSRIKGL